MAEVKDLAFPDRGYRVFHVPRRGLMGPRVWLNAKYQLHFNQEGGQFPAACSGAVPLGYRL